MARFLCALLLALALPLAACGHGHDHDHDFGTLEVCNHFDSDFDILDVEVEDEFGDVFIYSDVDILPGECVFIDDFFEGDYIVTLVWDDLTFDEFFVFIEDDEVTTIEAFYGV
jgi:hypothetical protein